MLAFIQPIFFFSFILSFFRPILFPFFPSVSLVSPLKETPTPSTAFFLFKTIAFLAPKLSGKCAYTCVSDRVRERMNEWVSESAPYMTVWGRLYVTWCAHTRAEAHAPNACNKTRLRNAQPDRAKRPIMQSLMTRLWAIPNVLRHTFPSIV